MHNFKINRKRKTKRERGQGESEKVREIEKKETDIQKHGQWNTSKERKADEKRDSSGEREGEILIEESTHSTEKHTFSMTVNLRNVHCIFFDKCQYVFLPQ